MLDLKDIISKSDYIISFGSFLAADNVEIQESIIESIAKNSAEFIYMHPIDNIDLKVYYSQLIKYEVGSEEAVAALLLDTFVKESDSNVKSFVDDLDIGYISAESSAGEEEFEEAYERSLSKSNKTIILGRDIFTHERVENIIKILSVIRKYSDINIVCLDENNKNCINQMSNEILEEVEDLHSYNGTVIYRTYGEENTDFLIGSESFARIAKIANNDGIFINFSGNKIEKSFKIDKNLYGTIALCAMNNDDSNSLSKGYRYKQVKIEKVDA